MPCHDCELCVHPINQIEGFSLFRRNWRRILGITHSHLLVYFARLFYYDAVKMINCRYFGGPRLDTTHTTADVGDDVFRVGD